MSCQILTVKLYELEKQIAKMQSRIQLSESANLPKIRAEIERLQEEYTESELALQNKLQYSRSEIVKILLSAYHEIEPAIYCAQEKIKAVARSYDNDEIMTETKLLLAEYELDFSMLSVERALMVSLDAIAAQLETEKEEKDYERS